MPILQNKLKDVRAQLDVILDQLLALPKTQEKRVVEAMRYSSLNAGKAIRPFLLISTMEMFAPVTQAGWVVAAALEMVHTYSLIHDDLPCMDDDDLRRGRPSCHKQFDEATALLAGDALLTRAFEVIAQNTEIAPEKRCELVALLARAAGCQGMIGGQMLDLMSENQPHMSVEELQRLQVLKTGQLLAYACEAGAILADASPEDRAVLQEYTHHLGLLFQITDDILDVEGSVAQMGKTLHKDEKEHKVTYVSLLGLEKAKAVADDLTQQALDTLTYFKGKAAVLEDLTRFVRTRNH
ncbi:MAG: polyprenyl synthetase family protein [Alphaproteobacteria bacterium]|nr:polyprenyl synthetase family protein [Alphaproteobacteria bacterium]